MPGLLKDWVSLISFQPYRVNPDGTITLIDDSYVLLKNGLPEPCYDFDWWLGDNFTGPVNTFEEESNGVMETGMVLPEFSSTMYYKQLVTEIKKRGWLLEVEESDDDLLVTIYTDDGTPFPVRIPWHTENMHYACGFVGGKFPDWVGDTKDQTKAHAISVAVWLVVRDVKGEDNGLDNSL